MRAALVIAALADLALAILLVAVSGFIFGPGPESMGGDRLAAAGWTAMLVACIAAPILGWVMAQNERPVGGVLVAWLPPAGALMLMALPPPY